MSNDLPTDDELTALDIDLSQFYGLQQGTFLRTLTFARDIERELRAAVEVMQAKQPKLRQGARKAELRRRGR